MERAESFDGTDQAPDVTHPDKVTRTLRLISRYIRNIETDIEYLDRLTREGACPTVEQEDIMEGVLGTYPHRMRAILHHIRDNLSH